MPHRDIKGLMNCRNYVFMTHEVMAT